MKKIFRKPYRIKRKKSIFKNKFFWILILTLIVFGEFFYLFCFSNFFQIKEIKISGNEKVPADQILSRVQQEIEQKLLFFSKKSIFLVNLIQIKKEILNDFPLIAEVNLERKFPAILEVKIQERKPVAIFNFDESYFFLDKEGIVFEEILSENQELLKIKSQTQKEKPELGERIIEKEIISKILKIFSELENLKIAIKEVLIISDERINVKTSEDWEIYFDPKKDLNWQLTKLKVDLENLIPFERRKDLEYIELRFGDLAPFKYRD